MLSPHHGFTCANCERYVYDERQRPYCTGCWVFYRRICRDYLYTVEYRMGDDKYAHERYFATREEAFSASYRGELEGEVTVLAIRGPREIYERNGYPSFSSRPPAWLRRTLAVGNDSS